MTVTKESIDDIAPHHYLLPRDIQTNDGLWNYDGRVSIFLLYL